jgi:hypothetical protein
MDMASREGVGQSLARRFGTLERSEKKVPSSCRGTAASFLPLSVVILRGFTGGGGSVADPGDLELW